MCLHDDAQEFPFFSPRHPLAGHHLLSLRTDGGADGVFEPVHRAVAGAVFPRRVGGGAAYVAAQAGAYRRVFRRRRAAVSRPAPYTAERGKGVSCDAGAVRADRRGGRGAQGADSRPALFVGRGGAERSRRVPRRGSGLDRWRFEGKKEKGGTIRGAEIPEKPILQNLALERSSGAFFIVIPAGGYYMS